MFIGNCPVPMGATIVDAITKKKGVVTAKYYQVGGCCVLRCVTDLLDQNNQNVIEHIPFQRAIWQEDIALLDFVDGGAEESNFEIGDQVFVELFGIGGAVTCICFYGDSSNHIEFQPPYNHKEAKMPPAINVAEKWVAHTAKEKTVNKLDRVEKPSPSDNYRSGPDTVPSIR